MRTLQGFVFSKLPQAGTGPRIQGEGLVLEFEGPEILVDFLRCSVARVQRLKQLRHGLHSDDDHDDDAI